jgi:hypothetical protein
VKFFLEISKENHCTTIWKAPVRTPSSRSDGVPGRNRDAGAVRGRALAAVPTIGGGEGDMGEMMPGPVAPTVAASSPPSPLPSTSTAAVAGRGRTLRRAVTGRARALRGPRGVSCTDRAVSGRCCTSPPPKPPPRFPATPPATLTRGRAAAADVWVRRNGADSERAVAGPPEVAAVAVAVPGTVPAVVGGESCAAPSLRPGCANSRPSTGSADMRPRGVDPPAAPPQSGGTCEAPAEAADLSTLASCGAMVLSPPPPTASSLPSTEPSDGGVIERATAARDAARIG